LSKQKKRKKKRKPAIMDQSKSPFHKVPLEILLRVQYHLTTPELCSLRLSCRSIEQSLFNTFSREFFTKKQFMLTEYSLQALIDISLSPRLSDCLTHVIISLDHLSPDLSLISPAMRPDHLVAFGNQLVLQSIGRDREMLTTAFQNLKHLTTVGIRDYNSRRRTRDGPGVEWRSYGATTVIQTTGTRNAILSTGDGHFGQSLGRVFTCVLHALAAANSRPAEIEVLKKFGAGLRDISFNLPQSCEATALPVLQNLSTLLIPVEFSHVPFQTHGNTGMPLVQPDFMLRNFLSKVQNLKHLRINFDSSHGSCTNLLRWLAVPHNNNNGSASNNLSVAADDSSTPVAIFPPSVGFPYLNELNLGFARFQPNDLAAVVAKLAPTLKRIELWKITLVHPEARIPSDFSSDSNKINLLALLFHQLRNIPGLNLIHLKFGHIFQEYGKGQSTPVQFRTDPSQSGRRKRWRRYQSSHCDVAEYTGSDWKHYLQELTAEIVLEIPDIGYNSPEESEEEEDDEDEDDEDDGDLGATDDVHDDQNE
jgi:hypothetical protein